jgi:hypothetical protein
MSRLRLDYWSTLQGSLKLVDCLGVRLFIGSTSCIIGAGS